jgi:glutamate N-acetyltransferase/amino-acid N-acetyltransferase
LAHGRARALVVNAGNSNAFTGQRGKDAVDAITAQVAAHLNCDASEVFVSSTGVIGVPLPIDKAQSGLRAVFDAAPCSWEDVTHTIGTTDTFAKGATASAMVDGRKVQLVGIIKGSGMIAPDMATMLGYIFTDAAVEPAFLQACLSAANHKTYSCITVDSDTSTSDTVLAFATGKAEYDEFQDWDWRLSAFAGPGYYFVKHDRTKLLGRDIIAARDALPALPTPAHPPTL